MINKKIVTGSVIGNFTVLEIIPGSETRDPVSGKHTIHSRRSFVCRCICGKIKTLKSSVIYRQVSCGCKFRRELNTRTHGMGGKIANGKRLKIYQIWCGMHQRCNNRSCRAFEDYGGRGIRICARWKKFENFFADMGHPLPGMSLNRRNNNGDYSPENCHWATKLEQAGNTRRTIHLTFDGKTQTLREWAADLNVKYRRLYKRYLMGWAVDRILSASTFVNQFK